MAKVTIRITDRINLQIDDEFVDDGSTITIETRYTGFDSYQNLWFTTNEKPNDWHEIDNVIPVINDDILLFEATSDKLGGGYSGVFRGRLISIES